MADAPPKKPPAIVELVWEHDLVFGGRSGEICMTLDSAAREGPSPVQALVFALAGCMAMDVVHILKKGRHDLRGLRADLVGERAQEEPRRVIAVDVRFTITGNVPGDLVQRAIDLSREKYCSVWHSMRQDIPMTTSFQVTSGL
ncbi:MAG TPA: OsmC family protein [Vicinamibacterales bacterium]|jgi:putative redox protein|nr:OsmC family protein [Vicinamibacterales bacterium]